ncbi:MAG: M23 family metallopeptidase [Puia sp.]|nr:M23 family metallopeptidase [Puia sp.]
MRYLLSALFVLSSLFSFSQLFPAQHYPRDYFRDPLGIPMSLAANFGELRPNHYHMGLDIRTEKRTNLPVYAAADGYVAHVKIEPAGFGQAIYIVHPNGYTTLYAHLNQFFPALAAYVKQQQYARESWSLFLDIPPGLFPVRKGDLIAYSGNTGGSQGPHLHFEIRSSRDDINHNPLLFGLPVPDDTPPVILRLAVYDRNRSVYEQSPLIVPVHKGNPGGSGTPVEYILSAPVIVNSPRVSFAISAFDTQSGSNNPNGIFQAILYDREQPVSGFQMDNISYGNTRNINAHIDYKTRATGGPWLQQLSALPGYAPSIYQTPRPGGLVDLSDGTPHAIRIEVKDANGNTAILQYQVQYRMAPVARTEYPGKMFYPGMLDGYEIPDCAFYIGEKCLYDSVHLNYAMGPPGLSGAVSAAHAVGEPFIPLQDSLLVRIRLTANIPAGKRDRIVLVCFAANKKDLARPQWQGDWASAKFREFGYFQLVEDRQAPQITTGFRDGANLSRAGRIVFNVKDNLGSIARVRAELDRSADGRGGQWLCFTNDKGLAYVYKFEEHCPPGKHTLTIIAEDVAGNRAERVFRFVK